MDTNSETSLKLTEFAPIDDDEKQATVSSYISNFFSKFTKSSFMEDTKTNSCDDKIRTSEHPTEEQSSEIDDYSDQKSLSNDGSSQLSIGFIEGRSLPNVLKRISNLLASKNTSLQAYSDTELRRYWMPDHVSKECFECSEKFTTWRRRHHCRLCGQIFCSRCCSQEIPGKLMGCTGDLRVCMYCCKIVLSYLPTSNVGAEMNADIRSLLESLQIKYGTANILKNQHDLPSSVSIITPYSTNSNTNLNTMASDKDNSTNTRRKISVGYQEEKFAIGRPMTARNNAISEERCRALQSSTSLRALYENICSNTNINGNVVNNGIQNERKLILASHRHRLRTYNQCFLGSELVDWLINHDKAKSRVEATALGQALLEAGYLENVLESPASLSATTNIPSFSDSPTGFYRPCPPSKLTFDLPPLRSSNSNQDFQKQTNEPAEPTWVQQIPQDGGTTTDSEAESHASPPVITTGTRLPSSSSSFYLDLDFEANTVHLVRPLLNSNSNDAISPTNLNETLSFQDIGNNDKDVPVPKSCIEQELVPSSGWHNAKYLREENSELETYATLNEAWNRHESAILTQFLNNEGLSLSWSGTIRSIINEVIDFVRPDMYHNADIINIREYVRVKTVPGGQTGRNECRVIRGIVCSKNVAHVCMQGRKVQPKILLLTCPLVYQRNEGKYMALEPVLLQEHEYLRHATARILAMKPNVILVARNASRLAQELLGEAGVALVTNVKNSVIDRVARASKADIVPSIDAANVGRRSWKLATCQEFYTQKFKQDEYSSKTLMFFEGLPECHLACTIILRGANKIELKKLKKVTLKMVFARYNWRLEQSFLMDEFAKPPSLKTNPLFDGSKENSPDCKCNSENKLLGQNKNVDEELIYNNNDNSDNNDNNDNNDKTDKSNETIFQQNDNKKSDGQELEDRIFVTCKSNIENEYTKTFKEIEISITNSNQNDAYVRKSSKTEALSDPLQHYEDKIFSKSSNFEQLSVKEMPLLNKFRKALDDTILSYSPFLTFTIPFLETDVGRRCKLRKFFPKEIYYSPQFFENNKKFINQKLSQNILCEKNINKINKTLYKMKCQHRFITTKLTTNVTNDEVQNLLANFRACGGRITYQHSSRLSWNCLNKFHTIEIGDRIGSLSYDQTELVDVLDLENHQRLAVLFCSFSSESNNSPGFCVDPCTKEMHFYGVMDAALGNFLEQYCFRDSYKCVSENCVTSMLKHTRRYVHHNGCITLNLNQMETQVSNNTIVMWTWCSKCNTVSPVVPMSIDTWSFSFAKFLELKIHAYMYGCRKSDGKCIHSLHHDHVHYFGYRNKIASFHYSSVELLELSLPNPRIEIKYNISAQQEVIIDQVKSLALKGHEVYSAILEKLISLPSELGGDITDLKQLLQKHQMSFKNKIEEVQLKLTSPTFENKKNDIHKSEVDNISIMWHLEDTLVLIKRLIAEACEVWNIRLCDIIQTQTRLVKPVSIPKSTTVKQQMLPQDSPLIKSNLSLTVTEIEGEQYAQIDSPTSPDYNVIDVANTTTMSFENFQTINSSKIQVSDNFQQSCSENKQAATNNYNSDDHEDDEHVANEIFIENLNQQQGHDEIPQEVRKDIHLQPDRDKKSMKTLLSQLLASPAATTPIFCPFSPLEHYLLTINKDIPIIVYENEPSSIIAYALTTQDYKKSLEELNKNKSCRISLTVAQKSETCSSPLSRRKLNTNDCDADDMLSSNNEIKQEATALDTKTKQQVNQSSHIDVQFQDSRANFMVRVHYAEQFLQLRSVVLSKHSTASDTHAKDFEEYEERYIRSLSRSVQWTARGGKSGSYFCKTKDDRFILKEMSTQEMDKFLVFAPNYFEYMNNCISSSQPTLLGKIIGVYRVCYKTASNSEKKNFLVMENLFYERKVTHKFDLKGSVRNRHVNIDDQDSEIVLLDENLLKMTCKSPLYIYPHSKTVLTTAIISDTDFLAAQSVMDYSLLVGLDPNTKELVVGIIDYIRTFTWDKKIETIVKKSGLLGGQGKLPTIISPEEYRNRFISAMHRYFLPVPGRWYGLNLK